MQLQKLRHFSPTAVLLKHRAKNPKQQLLLLEHHVTERFIPEALTRRAALIAALLPALLDESEPERGSCPTCTGVVDGTLGSCAGMRACMSSFDDRPGHFVAPWTYDSGDRIKAVRQLTQAIAATGGTVRQVEDTDSYGYVYAVWETWQGTDDVEFLLPAGDNTVVLRSAARAAELPDLGRNESRLEQLRVRLAWEPVPILRKRQRTLWFVESPWDSFGPVPPTDPNFRYSSDLDQDQ